MLLVHAVRVQFDYYCFPYDLVHVPGFSGHATGATEHDLVAEVNAVFSNIVTKSSLD
jgi:hypothetical protein